MSLFGVEVRFLVYPDSLKRLKNLRHFDFFSNYFKSKPFARTIRTRSLYRIKVSYEYRYGLTTSGLIDLLIRYGYK